jgi:hypothetical protein
MSPTTQTTVRSLLKDFRRQTAAHPYRTIGVAALAGMLLANRSARALAGWAGLRLGWSALSIALRDRDQGLTARAG